MPIRTLLTERLGISHPILLAPMDVVADARLTSAVSAAGGLGILGGAYGDEQWLSRELDILSNSRARFGVGFITWSMAKQPKLLDLVLERKPAVVGTRLQPGERRCGSPVSFTSGSIRIARCLHTRSRFVGCAAINSLPTTASVAVIRGYLTVASRFRLLRHRMLFRYPVHRQTRSIRRKRSSLHCQAVTCSGFYSSLQSAAFASIAMLMMLSASWAEMLWGNSV